MLQFTRLSVVIATLVHTTYAFISRLPCSSTGDFRVKKPDFALQNAVIETFYFLDINECREKCLHNTQCKSINYEERRDMACELNNKTSEDVADKIGLIPRKGWMFMSTDYTFGAIGKVCSEQKPCGKNVFCKDACECPSHTCHECDINTIAPNCVSTWTDCQKVKEAGFNKSGEFLVTTDNNPLNAFPVYCDLKTENKGWIVFQRRIDDTVDFNRTWIHYKNGFGTLNGNLWLGLDKISQLTSHRAAILRCDVIAVQEPTAKYFTEYNEFRVAGESTNYAITLRSYNEKSTAGNGLLPSGEYAYHYVDGSMFSTKDRDNDSSDDKHCAVHFNGGWWHVNCFYSNLNGIFSATHFPTCVEWTKDPQYMTWYPLKHCYGGIIYSEMKIRYIDKKYKRY